MERRKMSLDSDSGGSSQKIAENAYAQLVTIKDVEDQSNYPFDPDRTPPWKSGKKPQLLLKVTYTHGEREGTLLLMGKYELKNGAISEWKTFGNGVHIFLGTLFGTYDLEADWSIPFDVLQECIGKEIKIVRYMTGKKFDYQAKDGSYKVSWNTWDVVFPPDATIEQMQAKFGDQVDYLMQARGYDPSRKIERKKEDDEEVPDNPDNYPTDEPVI